MRLRLLLLSLIALTQIAVASTKKNTSSFTSNALVAPQDRNTVLSSLKKIGYFKKKSCKDVVDAVLVKAKAPKISEKKIETGVLRGTFDRSKEAGELPTLTDEVFLNDRDLEIRIAAQKKASNYFLVEVERAERSKNLAVRSTMAFQPVRRNGEVFCELSRFALAWKKLSDRGLTPAREYTVKDCLDSFVINRAFNVQGDELAKDIFSQLRSHCAFGFQFYPEPRAEVL